MADEPDATGARNYGGLGGGFNLKLPELDSARDTVVGLHSALEGLRTALGKFNSFTASSLTNVLKSIQREAQVATQAVYGVAGSFGGGGGGGGGGGTAFSGANYVATASTQIASSVGRMPGGINGSQYFAGGSGGAIASMAMVIPNFIRERFTTNRNNSLQGAGAFSLLSRQQGVNPADVMGNLGNNGMPVMGTPSDMFSLFGMAPALGASYSFNGSQDRQGVRARGFFTGVQQAQAMNPYQDVGSIAGTIGGYAANTGAQQQSAFLTGGAMSIIGGGGRQKSLSEWAESVLKWLQDLRGGSRRGKAFKYGELMAQYFPGSNIDAWFNVNGVPPQMREYWWTYALQKADKGGAQGTGGGEMKIGGDDENLAFKRLQATHELTKTEFSLSQAMGGAYLNREVMNRWFNQFAGSMQQMAMPAIAKAFPFVQYIPDTVEDMLYSGAQAGAQMGGGLLEQFLKNKVAGDIGDYGDVGGTSTSGMHPDMKRKVGAMMKANPRLSVTSGLRDTNMQRRLKDKGYSRVSGKGSAHTRGMAADLGPSSEYGWIAANAGKFGLKSGRSQGEPWHVGMGDVGDPVSDALGGIGGFDWSSLLGSLSGGMGAGVDAAGGVAANMVGGITGLFDWLLGALGLSGGTTQGPEYQPGLYESLFGAQKQGMSQRGLPTSTWGSAPNPATGSRSYAMAHGSLDDRGKQAAIVAHNAGFSGSALEQMVAIAGRESHFDPLAHRSNRTPKVPEYGDRGLWQINFANDAQLKKAGIISTASDLFKPETNAAAAYYLYQRAGNTFSPWSAAAGVGWSSGGDPSYGTDVSAARDIIHSAGLGDIDAMTYAAMLPRGGGGGGSMMQFNNTFQIGGGSGGAGAGGIDVRRTVTMIADELEGEMKRRSARTN